MTPVVLVIHGGPRRRCANMCAGLERHGFNVLCGDAYGEAPERLRIVPDAVIVRTDEPSTIGAVRAAFSALPLLRAQWPAASLFALTTSAPSGEERELADAAHARLANRQNVGFGRGLAEAIDDALNPQRS